jgi:hypothetical protein
MNIKRIDRTVQMMRELQKETADALEAAALKLQAISKQSVSRKYTKKPKRQKSDEEKRLDQEHIRKQVREFFLNKKPKTKPDGQT